MMDFVGIDGCKGGWLAVTRDDTGLQFRLLQNIDALELHFADATRILIDIPIGLPWPKCPVRPCDRRARQLLGRKRSSSVFPVPCRETLAALTFEEAQRINEARIGRSVGSMTWGISPKIAEVDTYLRQRKSSGINLREVHPEVCFWALHGQNPMEHSKTDSRGHDERLRVLRTYLPEIDSFLSRVLDDTRRKDVKPDDVLDATVAFLTSQARGAELVTITGEPGSDAVGLPMEMLYLRTSEAVAQQAHGPDSLRSQVTRRTFA